MNDYKIYRYIDPEHLPQSSSYFPGQIIFPEQLNRLDIPKKTNILYGERRQTIYFDRHENDEYLEPFIKIDYKFNRDERGLVVSKLTTISYMLEANRWSDRVKTGTKIITDPNYKLQEIKRRRYNIINELKYLAKIFDLEQYILSVFEENQLLINSYIDAGSAKFRDAILKSEDEWLDEVIPATGNKSRDVIVQYTSIGLA